MNLQERYDELDNIIRTLDDLIGDITDKSYIDQLRETMYQAQNELEIVEKRLQKQYELEDRELENEYWRSVV